jgi:serine/threonine protein phosphatase PrpC
VIHVFSRSKPALRVHADVYTSAGSYPVNEDAAGTAAASRHTLLVVADGLGGHEGAEAASRRAVARAVELFGQHPSTDAPALEALVLGAHRAMRDGARGAPAKGWRTTLTLLVADGVSASWAHVGDSRVYHFHDGRIRTRTRDHSVPEMLHRAGEIPDSEIRRHPDRGRLLQALGQQTEPRVTISERVVLEDGDAFLLCSDGWWDALSDSEMEDALRASQHPREWLHRMAAAISAAAIVPQDNYTAVAAFVAAS